jgi:hypothetical protein
MTFAQRRNRLTTHYSERIPVVKRRKSVFILLLGSSGRSVRLIADILYDAGINNAKSFVSIHPYTCLSCFLGIGALNLGDLYGSHPVVFIAKQTTLIRFNSAQVYFNLNCCVYMCATWRT